MGRERSTAFDTDILAPVQREAIEAIRRGNRKDEQAFDLQTYRFVFYDVDGTKEVMIDESMITDDISPIIQIVDKQME